MTKTEFEKEYRINWKRVEEHSQMHNISKDEALWQMIDDAYELYKEDLFDEEVK